MTKYAIISKQDEESKTLKEKMKADLKDIYDYNDESPELLITIGGDGTMLYAIHQYSHRLNEMSFIGLHTGTLGFLTDYQKEDYHLFIEDLKAGDFSIEKKNLLEVKVNKDSYYAINEVRIENNMRAQVLDIHINNEFFETFRGNGLCISSSIGSTAYNKSLGGAVLYSDYPLMQLSEIAGIHHNAYRSLGSPLVLDDSHTITIASDNFEDAILGVDQQVIALNHVDSISIGISQLNVQFSRMKETSLIQRLKRSFLSL